MSTPLSSLSCWMEQEGKGEALKPPVMTASAHMTQILTAKGVIYNTFWTGRD